MNAVSSSEDRSNSGSAVRRPTVRRLARWVALAQAVQLVLTIVVLVADQGHLAIDSPTDWMEHHAPWLQLVAPSFSTWSWWEWSAPLALRLPVVIAIFVALPVGWWVARSRRVVARRWVGWLALALAVGVAGGLQLWDLLLFSEAFGLGSWPADW